MSGPRRRAVAILGTLAVVAGVWGLIAARNLSFTAARGAPLSRFNITLSLLGALVTLLGGVLALVATGTGNRVVAALPGLLFGAAALLTLIGVGRSFNPLGGIASTLSFFMLLAVGLLSLAVVPELEGTAAGSRRGGSPPVSGPDDSPPVPG